MSFKKIKSKKEEVNVSWLSIDWSSCKPNEFLFQLEGNKENNHMIYK